MTHPRSDFWVNLALCLGMTGILVFALSMTGSALTERGLFVGPPEPDPRLADELSAMQMEVVAMEASPGGTVRAGFVFYNGGAASVRDIRLVCDFFDAEQEYVGRHRWFIPQVVKPGVMDFAEAEERFFVPRRAAGVQCEMVSLKTLPVSRQDGHGAGGKADGHEGDGQTP